jgi:hypothetical protein
MKRVTLHEVKSSPKLLTRVSHRVVQEFDTYENRKLLGISYERVKNKVHENS